jgi:hypothetical protein
LLATPGLIRRCATLLTVRALWVADVQRRDDVHAGDPATVTGATAIFCGDAAGAGCGGTMREPQDGGGVWRKVEDMYRPTSSGASLHAQIDVALRSHNPPAASCATRTIAMPVELSHRRP